MIDTLKQTLDTVSASNRRNEELVRKLTDQVELLQKMIKNLEDRNNRHNKHAFGKSSLKKNKRVEEKKSREEDKEDYDGNHDALNHEEKSADDSSPLLRAHKKLAGKGSALPKHHVLKAKLPHPRSQGEGSLESLLFRLLTNVRVVLSPTDPPEAGQQ